MRATKILLGPCLIVGLMGCSTALVKSDFDHAVNFAGHRTFAWTTPPQNSDSGYYAQNSLFEKRLKNAVEREFAAKGFHLQTGGTPDFLIAYHVDFEDKMEVSSYGHDYWPAYNGYGPSYYGLGFSYWPGYYSFGFRSRYYSRLGSYGIGRPYLREYKQITLTLDFLNPETKTLIWRGWYVDRVGEANINEEKIAKAVERILEKYPPKRENDDSTVRIMSTT